MTSVGTGRKALFSSEEGTVIPLVGQIDLSLGFPLHLSATYSATFQHLTLNLLLPE